MNIYVSLLTNRKAKPLTVIGEPGLSQKCSTAVRMMLAGIHVSSNISIIYLNHLYLKIHEYTLMNKESSKGGERPALY